MTTVHIKHFGIKYLRINCLTLNVIISKVMSYFNIVPFRLIYWIVNVKKDKSSDNHFNSLENNNVKLNQNDSQKDDYFFQLMNIKTLTSQGC